jgi:hypothetical protein
MGADLIIAACPLEITKAAALKKFKAMTKAKLKAVAKALDMDDDDGEFTEVKELILTGLNTAYAGPQWSRELSYIRYKGVKIAVTGGMSWGDTPTDLYDAIAALDASGVTHS